MIIGAATWKDVIENRARWSFENRNGLLLAKELKSGSVHHVIGDPPYDDKTHDNARSLKDGGSDIKIDFEPLPPCETFVPDLLRIARRWVLQCCTQEMTLLYQIASGDVYMFHGRVLYKRSEAERNYIRALWWVRTNGTPQISQDRAATPGETIVALHSDRWEKKRWNGGGERGYYIGPRCDDAERMGHPTQKPKWLMMKLIEQYTDPDDIIFDWSSGVATTGVAALELGRRFIGTELKGPCPICGGGIPSSWEGDLKRKILAVAPDLTECVHGHVNYHAIGSGRLARAESSMKPTSLFKKTDFRQIKIPI